MTLFVYILSTLFMLFGIGLFFSPARGSFVDADRKLTIKPG